MKSLKYPADYKLGIRHHSISSYKNIVKHSKSQFNRHYKEGQNAYISEGYNKHYDHEMRKHKIHIVNLHINRRQLSNEDFLTDKRQNSRNRIYKTWQNIQK